MSFKISEAAESFATTVGYIRSLVLNNPNRLPDIFHQHIQLVMEVDGSEVLLKSRKNVEEAIHAIFFNKINWIAPFDFNYKHNKSNPFNPHIEFIFLLNKNIDDKKSQNLIIEGKESLYMGLSETGQRIHKIQAKHTKTTDTEDCSKLEKIAMEVFKVTLRFFSMYVSLKAEEMGRLFHEDIELTNTTSIEGGKNKTTTAQGKELVESICKLIYFDISSSVIPVKFSFKFDLENHFRTTILYEIQADQICANTVNRINIFGKDILDLVHENGVLLIKNITMNSQKKFL